MALDLRAGSANDYFRVPSPTSLNAPGERWTLATWLRLDTTSNGTAFMTHQYPGSGKLPMLFGIADSASFTNDTGKFSVGLFDGAGWQAISSGFAPAVGVWYHFAGSYDGTTMSAYVNGVLLTSATKTGAGGTSSTEFRLGRRWDGSAIIDGQMFDAAVWYDTLQGAEIAALARLVRPGEIRPGSLQAWWELNDLSGVDSTGKNALLTSPGTVGVAPNPVAYQAPVARFDGFTTDLGTPFLNIGVGLFTPDLLTFLNVPFLSIGVGLTPPVLTSDPLPPFVPPPLPPTLVPGTSEGPGVPLPPLSSGGLAGIRFYQGPPWRWVVTDLDTQTLTFLDRLAAEAVVTYTLDKGATAQLSVPSGNPEVNILADDGDPFLSEGNRLLYGFRREGGGPGDSIWKCRFAGRILLVEDHGLTEDARTTITAYDPWQLMYQRPMVNYVDDFPDKAGFFSFNDTQVGGIAGLFLRNTILNQGELGIDMGDTTPTWSTDNAQPTPNPVPLPGTPYWGSTYDAVWSGRTNSVIETTSQVDTSQTQQGMMVGEVFDLMVQSGAVDFLLTPIYDPVRRPGYTHELSIYNRAGVQATDAIFAWDKPSRNLTQINSLRDGTKRANNIRYYSETGGPPVNAGIPISWAPSEIKYGQSWHEEFWPARDQVGAAAMAELQLELLKNGIWTVEVTPSPERAPFVFSEYWLGDTVPVYASNQLRQEIAGFQRIYGIVLNIDENSYEQLPSLLVSPDTA